MPFTVDTRRVTNHKEVCYKKKTKEGKYPYADATYHLAWGSMAIGIGEITKNNFTEVYSRHKFLHNVSGLSIPFNLTLRDVYAHIGLTTNVAPEKTAPWRNRIAKGEWQSITFDTAEKASNINEISTYGGTK
jgi:hypothetical protein